MFDSHCHLADEAYLADLPETVARARGAGLADGVCVVATGDEAEAARAARAAALWPELRFATGLHPHAAARFAGGVDRLEEQWRLDSERLGRVAAVGEIGLDYHYDLSPRAAQREVFAAQVDLARRLGMPAVIHTREADEDTLAILRGSGIGGVFHCFSGDERLAREALELGFHLSFSGILTFPKADGLRAIARSVPAERLLVETDCPYLAPVPHRGKRNEPAWVLFTLHALAACRDEPVDRLAGQLEHNFSQLFGPPRGPSASVERVDTPRSSMVR